MHVWVPPVQGEHARSGTSIDASEGADYLNLYVDRSVWRDQNDVQPPAASATVLWMLINLQYGIINRELINSSSWCIVLTAAPVWNSSEYCYMYNISIFLHYKSSIKSKSTRKNLRAEDKRCSASSDLQPTRQWIWTGPLCFLIKKSWYMSRGPVKTGNSFQFGHIIMVGPTQSTHKSSVTCALFIQLFVEISPLRHPSKHDTLISKIVFLSSSDHVNNTALLLWRVHHDTEGIYWWIQV